MSKEILSRENGVIVRQSTFLSEQLGVIANQGFQQGDLVFTIEGPITPNRTKHSFQIDKNLHIEPADEDGSLGHHLNHSCEPNAAIRISNGNIGQIEVIAMSNIEPDQEVTVDYATMEYETTVDNHPCKCRSLQCRKFIYGYKDLPPEKKAELRSRGLIPDHLLKQDAENTNISGDPLKIEDMDEAIELARKAYPEKIRKKVIASLVDQKQAMLKGLDSGTRQFKIKIDGKIAGVYGFYKRGDACPDNVIWGDWFFIDPAKRNTVLTYRMGVELIKRAKESGYEHMYVETTADQPDYFNIAPYLLRFGFNQMGNLSNYFEKGVDLIFFGLNLKTWQPRLRRHERQI